MVLESHISGLNIRCSRNEHQKHVTGNSTIRDMGQREGENNENDIDNDYHDNGEHFGVGDVK